MEQAIPPRSTRAASELAARLKEVGRKAGLSYVGIADAEPLLPTRRVLEERRALGLHDTMQFTYRNPTRSTSPALILPHADSLVVAARSYPWGQARPVTQPDREGRIASYAWRDYYAELRRGLEAMAAELRSCGFEARSVADDNALVDRAVAVKAGLGWWGKNSNVLFPGAGSFFVLGTVVTNAALPTDEPVQTDCGSCRRCLDGCPTGAIVSPGVVDAGRCLAWLLQREGMFPLAYREALGNRIYGCDDCQEVCPPNRQTRSEDGSESASQDGDAIAGHTSAGVDHSVESNQPVAAVDLVELLRVDDAELLKRHGRWYIPRRDVNYIRRNALVALANASATAGPGEPSAEVSETVATYLRHGDPMLRAHAVWAARRIGAPHLAASAEDDPDERVREEALRP